MVTMNEAVLHDRRRLAAVDRARRALPALPMPLDAIAGLAARLLGAPMGVVTLVGQYDEYFAGLHGLPSWLASSRQAPLAYSVCKFMVSEDAPVCSADMAAEDDLVLRRHPLRTEFGVRAFLGVPVRDADDRPIGSVSVLDTEPRPWADADLSTLLEIAHLVDLPAGRPGDDPAAALGEQRRFLTALLDNLDVGVVAVGHDGRPVLINRALRRIYDIPDELSVDTARPALAGSLCDLDGEPLPVGLQPLIRALRGDLVRAADVLIRTADQRDRIFVVHAQRLTTDEGGRAGAVAALHEVTAIRRAERFRTCERRVTQLLSAAATVGDAVAAVLREVAGALGWPHVELWLADPLTGGLRQAGHWSARAGQCAGPGPATVEKGRGLIGAVWATGQPVWIPDVADLVTLTPEQSLTRARTCTDMDLHTALAVPVRDGDVVLGVLTGYAAAREVDRNLLTFLLGGVAAQLGLFVTLRRAADLAEQLARTRNDFLTLVGHALRTPLASISSYADLLAGEAPPDATPMIAAIDRNAGLLRAVVDDLLDLAGMEAGHLELTLARTDLPAIVRAAATAAAPAAETNGVRLHVHAPKRLALDADAARLRQAIDALLANAITYSPDGGDVHIRLRADDDAVELRITDTGIGVPPGDRDHVFDRFYRAGNVQHHGFPGAGLGLALVHTITTLHGGAITLDTAHEPGTALVLRLPRHARIG